MYDLFDTFFNPWYDDSEYSKKAPKQQAAQTTQNLMKTDIKENDKGYELDVDLPGYKKEDVKAELKDGYLTISASNDNTKEEKDEDGKYIRKERYTGSVSRSFYVGKYVTEEDIHAKFENGILKLSVPKVDAPKVEENKYISIEG